MAEKRCQDCGALAKWNLSEPDGEVMYACDRHLGRVIEVNTTAGVVHVSRI